jgi:hypothetical protein
MERLPFPTWWRLYSIGFNSVAGIGLCAAFHLPTLLNRLLVIVIVTLTFRAILRWLNVNATALEVEDARQQVIAEAKQEGRQLTATQLHYLIVMELRQRGITPSVRNLK